MKFFVGILSLAVIAFVSACDSNNDTGERGTESDQWSGSVEVGDEIRIINISGSITTSLTPRDEVFVRWTKHGDMDDLPRVDILVSSSAAGVTIRAAYPDESVDVGVDFEVEVPAGVDFAAQNVSGSVYATDLESDVFVSVISGSATISTTELAEAHVISGTVDADIRTVDWDHDLSFSVTSGTLRVRIPSNVNAEVNAAAISGTVTCDFPLAGTSSNRHGTIGMGGPLLNLSVVSGNVYLHSGPAA